MNRNPQSDPITASLVVIGDEILSGRTRDENIPYLASFLGAAGIELCEVRIVLDREEPIVAAVTALRPRYTYVFTTGGIGPTHDDITTEAIGKAFGVPVEIDSRAVAAMRRGYAEDGLTPARLLMARIPEGAELIDNPISHAPGFMIGNVIVLAGVPRIMQAMLDRVAPRLKKGQPFFSRSLRIDVPEGDAAPILAGVQAAHAGVRIGSYPFFERGRVGTYAVIRASDSLALEAALRDLCDRVREAGLPALPVEEGEERAGG